MKNFDELGLSPALNAALKDMKYETPTPIQAQAIPLALEGRDIMGSAQTGTGKTAAYSIPAIEFLLANNNNHVLVLTPTRELGKQVMDIMKLLLGRQSSIKTAFIIGGEAMQKQYGQLRQGPRLVVGTPGRINDHLKRGTLKLDKTNFLVLDETDRMLDMGFSIQLDEIFKYMPKERQTLMFSATLPKNIMKMSENYLKNPERVAVGSLINPAENITQDVVRLQDGDKYEELTRQLERREGSIIIFVKTKRSADKMSKKLNDAHFTADTIHGDLKQNRRDRVIREFRGQRFRILVATDVAARGLDIPHIEHVINYDIPQVPEDYIHRIGRTARAGAEGNALSFVTPTDGRKWYDIERLMNPDAQPSGPIPPGKNSKHNRKKKAYVSSRSRKKNGFGGSNNSANDGERNVLAQAPDSKPKGKFAPRDGDKGGNGAPRRINKDGAKFGGKPGAGKPNAGKPHSGKPSGKPYAGKKTDKNYSDKKKPFNGKNFAAINKKRKGGDDRKSKAA